MSIGQELIAYFWRGEQLQILLLGLGLWLVLRYRLVAGSRYVLNQSMAFFILCLFGELGGVLMGIAGWDNVSEGVLGLSLLGVGIALIRMAGMFLFRLVMPQLKFQVPRILEDITVIAGYCVWAVVRLRQGGVDLSHIVATSAVITGIIAFAMQDTLGNILGGLAIHLDHSVEIGDWVVMDGVSGRVEDIRWRYTKIVTRNGEKVVVPNSFLMKNRFSVVGADTSRNNAWRRSVWFNVSTDYPPHRVRDVVSGVVHDARIANVAHEPAPNVVAMEFGNGFIRYALRYWLTDPQVDDPTDSEVRIHVFNALERSGMSLAIPEEIRHTVKENQSHISALAERETLRRLEALATVDLFRHLTDEELKALAAHLVHSPFARGDIITRQGSTAHWLYILIAGDAEVWLEGTDGERRLLSTLHEGAVFGEMGLMTGEPRRATVIAATDVDCYRLDKTGLATILKARPAIADEISHILAAREVELEQLRQHLDDSAQERRRLAGRETLLTRMREFFKLPG